MIRHVFALVEGLRKRAKLGEKVEVGCRAAGDCEGGREVPLTRTRKARQREARSGATTGLPYGALCHLCVHTCRALLVTDPLMGAVP